MDGQQLVEIAEKLNSQIKGMDRLISQIKAEIQFINRETAQKCTNMPYFNSLLAAVQTPCDIQVSELLVPIEKNVRIDIVANDGLLWIKVKNNIKALNYQVVMAQDLDEDVPLLVQLHAWKEASLRNKRHFRTPQIVVRFMTQDQEPRLDLLDERILVRLRELDIGVQIQSLKTGLFVECPLSVTSRVNVELSQVNLDVTTLVALCSDICHTPSMEFPMGVKEHPVLPMQIDYEKEEPFLNWIHPLTHQKILICSSKAMQHFTRIVETIANQNEKTRAHALCQSIKVFECPCELDVSDSVYFVAQKYKALTVTANRKLAGRLGSVALHKPRSFIGNK